MADSTVTADKLSRGRERTNAFPDGLTQERRHFTDFKVTTCNLCETDDLMAISLPGTAPHMPATFGTM
jgi:hypothetical protein